MTILLLGAVVGLVLALTGAGGGILAVPLLVFGLHLDMAQAAPVALTAVAVAAALGAGLGLREGIVRYRAAALIGAAGVASAPAGIWLAKNIPDRPLMIGFAGILVYVAVRMFHATGPSGDGAAATRPAAPPCALDLHSGRLAWTRPCARALACTGIVSGLCSGLLGVGGGFVVVPALTRLTALDPRSIGASSLAVIALVSLGAVGGAAAQGTIAWELAVPFAAGAALALLAARRAAARWSGARLQRAFALTCVIVAALLVGKALGWVSA